MKKVLTLMVVAVLLLGAGITLSQNSKAFAASTSTSTIGYVDFQLLMSQHPDMAAAQQTMQAAADQAKKDFDAKSATMNDQEKKDYYNQLQQQLNTKQQDVFGPIRDKVIAAVKDVADAKGITLVVEKGAAIYGGQDITADVGKKLTGK